MKSLPIIVIFLFLFQACSSPQPDNNWQYQATSFSNAYTKHYLEGNTLRAKVDISRARELSSRSAQLHTLINIELNVCALDIGSLQANKCKNAADLLLLEPDPSQKAYLALLNTQLSSTQVKELPPQYQAFASALLKNDIEELNEQTAKVEPVSSRLIASALIKEKLDEKKIQGLIDTLSYHGYKTPLIAWLKFQIQKEKDSQRKAKLKAKLEVLISR